MSWTKLLLGLAMAVAGFGEDPGDWAAVTLLSPGSRVEVVHGQLRKASGRFAGASMEEVRIETDAGVVAIARDAVVRVSRPGRSRKRRALIGAAIGAAAGAGVAALGANAGDIDIRRDYVVGAGVALGAGVGAGVGAASGGPVTVYRRH
ncbi:MAG: hypothetical protein R2748_34725 [Bryobacterales bacterium]